MLVLTRRRNEKVRLTDDQGKSISVSPSFVDSRRKIIKLEIEGQHALHMDLKHDKINLSIPETSITLLDVSGNQARLGFKAPKSVHIVREELL